MVIHEYTAVMALEKLMIIRVRESLVESYDWYKSPEFPNGICTPVEAFHVRVPLPKHSKLILMPFCAG